eukprot:403343808
MKRNLNQKRTLDEITKTPPKSKTRLVQGSNPKFQEKDQPLEQEINVAVKSKRRSKQQKQSERDNKSISDFFFTKDHEKNLGKKFELNSSDQPKENFIAQETVRSNDSGSVIDDLDYSQIKFVQDHNIPSSRLSLSDEKKPQSRSQSKTKQQISDKEEVKQSSTSQQKISKSSLNKELLEEVSLGQRLFKNRIKAYAQDYKDENMLTFNQMMDKCLLPEDDAKFQIDVKSAIFSSFEFEDVLMAPLFENKIPTTIFEDKLKRVNPDIFIQEDEFNSNKVNVYQYGTAKSDNMFSKLNQVYVAQNIAVPYNLKKQENLFRQKINLDDFDFSKASVHLIESINGRLKSDKKTLFGLLRMQNLLKDRQPFPENSKVWIQASSISRMWPKYLVQFYFYLTGILVSEERVHTHFGFIYPTEQYCRKTYLGIHNCDCLHLKSTSWNMAGFPKGSFYRYEGRTKELDRNIAHSKVIIITRDSKGIEIDDDTVIYTGSHNMSQNAWGKDEKNGEQFTIANWELGIMKGPEKGSKELKQKWTQSFCFKFPPTKYQFGDLPYFGDVDYK